MAVAHIALPLSTSIVIQAMKADPEFAKELLLAIGTANMSSSMTHQMKCSLRSDLPTKSELRCATQGIKTLYYGMDNVLKECA